MRLSTNVVVTALLTAGIGAGQNTLAPPTVGNGGGSNAAHDPGVRGGAPGAGGMLPNLGSVEMAGFTGGLATFSEIDDVSHGLGPRINPQVEVAHKMGAANTVPPFITSDGPVREVRFKQNRDGSRDGGVHGLFTIKGRTDAPGCGMTQPDFSNTNNLSFRIPTPIFGGGLIEAITDSTLKNNLQQNAAMKQRLGISGRLNTNGNDGTITRFGWKAQNKSLLVFSGEAYNVEQGVTNTVFMTERDEDGTCATNAFPEDGFPTDSMTDVLQFTTFMRFLDQPKPVPTTAASVNGRALFTAVGCALCHTPTLMSGNSKVAALRNQAVNLFSDLALHQMGSGLADNIQQGDASGTEFRTAPLWGLGQRIFFLHDGRTTDLVRAIREHSSQGSEANAVIAAFSALSASDQQQILEFLRTL